MTKCDDCPMAEGRDCDRVLCAFYHSGNATKVAHVRHLATAAGADPGTFPPLATQVARLAGAVGRFVASGLATTTAEERARRRAICGECPEFVEGRCRRCGCHLKYKQSMASEHCPLEPPRW